MTKRTHASKSVIRHKQMKAKQHLQAVSNRRAQRKVIKQVKDLRKQYTRMNGSVFSGNRTFKRLKPQVEKILKIKNPDYNQRQHIKAVVRDFNNHSTANFNGSRNIYRSSVKTVYNFANERYGNKWKPLMNKEIPTPQSVQAAKKFWSSYHKVNDILEAEHGSQNVFGSDTKLTYLTGHTAGDSDDIAHDTVDDLLSYAKPSTGIVL